MLTGERCRVAGSPAPSVGPVRVYSHTQPHTFDRLVYTHPLNTQMGAETFFRVVSLSDLNAFRTVVLVCWT